MGSSSSSRRKSTTFAALVPSIVKSVVYFPDSITPALLARLRLGHVVADPGLGEDEPWVVGVVSQLATQVLHGAPK